MNIAGKRPEPSSVPPVTVIHVVEPGMRPGASALRCKIGENVKFSTASLESYFFAHWVPDAWDALLVAGAVEFADRTKRRPAYMWRRRFALRVPVHSPQLWKSSHVETSLRDALEFLTGDEWQFEFVSRRKDVERPNQIQLSLNPEVEAVIPFSDGLDSCAVAGLFHRQMGDRLIQIRLAPGLNAGKRHPRQREAFTRIPYAISRGQTPFVESSARSRGFKFGAISGIAAYLAGASKVIVPESGQGALGPALVTVGQAGEDCRSHPLFTRRMETFLKALLGFDLTYQFPQIWQTKAETLRQFVNECRDPSWAQTISCWQQNRQSSVEREWRHCGVCAACMLRRLSVHAADLTEAATTYVWEDLSAPTFEAGAAPNFPRKHVTSAMREYAIAGTLHLDHLAGMLDSPANAPKLDLAAYQLGELLGTSEEAARTNLNRLLWQHRLEWKHFLDSLGGNAFIRNWALGTQS